MSYSANIIIQYIIVGIALLAVVIWIVRKIIHIRKSGQVASCCGCSMAEACKKNINSSARMPSDSHANSKLQATSTTKSNGPCCHCCQENQERNEND